jgi:hypothetical protein
MVARRRVTRDRRSARALRPPTAAAALAGASVTVLAMAGTVRPAFANNYYPAYDAYFINNTASSLGTNISGNDVFVGKNNPTSFTTVTTPVTYNIDTANADITSGPDESYPTSPFLYIGLNSFGSSIVNISNGSVEYAEAWDTSNINISGGTLSQGIVGANNSTIDVTGGSVGNSLVLQDSSTANIAGGNVNTVEADTGATVNISGGGVTQVDDFGGVTNATGGSVNVILGGGNISGSATVGEDHVEGSDNTLNVTGGSLGYFFDQGIDSTVNISGGTETALNENDMGGDDGTLNISGGVLNSFLGGDASSTINISGGTGLGFIQSSGTVNFIGSDFVVVNEGNDTFQVTGNLADPTPIDVIFFGDGIDTTPTFTANGLSFTASPEPGSLPLVATVLAAVPVAVIVRRRRGACGAMAN